MDCIGPIYVGSRWRTCDPLEAVLIAEALAGVGNTKPSCPQCESPDGSGSRVDPSVQDDSPLSQPNADANQPKTSEGFLFVPVIPSRNRKRQPYTNAARRPPGVGTPHAGRKLPGPRKSVCTTKSASRKDRQLHPTLLRIQLIRLDRTLPIPRRIRGPLMRQDLKTPTK
jgi:hypothetical protein